MEALILRVTIIAITVFVSTGASHRTPNFVVNAPALDEARQVGVAAEEYRRRLAIYWLGKDLPRWSRPCTLTARTGSYGPSGKTTFQFVGKHVTNWQMTVNGSLQRILDSVLPHEVNHTIFASHFRRPLPRWADEGAATLFEHRSEQRIQLELLQKVIRKGRGFIPLSNLLNMKQYPTGRMPMLTMYAEGYGLVNFLMHQGGRQTYLEFLKDGHEGRWEDAIRKHYNHGGIGALEKDWKSWVLAGMPQYGTAPEQMIALIGAQTHDLGQTTGQTNPRRSRSVRGQSPESEWPARTATSRPAVEQLQRRRSTRASAASKSRVVKAPDPVPVEDEEPVVFGQSVEATRKSKAVDPFAGSAIAPQPGFQPTRHKDEKSDPALSYEKYLPWKRTEESGSTPQWAGFPGQEELF